MKRSHSGFTLIELAIVLVIVTILVGGLAVPLSAQIEARRIGETRKTMEEAREALIGYAMTNSASSSSCICQYTVKDVGTCPVVLDTTNCSPVSLCPATASLALPSCPAPGTGPLTLTLPIARHHLPCPDLNGADPEPDSDNDGIGGLTDLNNGAEDRIPGTAIGNAYAAGPSCAAPTGNLPWVTLATAAQDAWGNRLRYTVTPVYANSDTGFSNADLGNKQICNTSAGGCAVGTVARDVPLVLVSYGPNGWGARSVNNSNQAAPASNDEIENANLNDAYVSRPPSQVGVAAGEFDDLVVWISRPLLISRVCPAGGCP